MIISCKHSFNDTNTRSNRAESHFKTIFKLGNGKRLFKYACLKTGIRNPANGIAIQNLQVADYELNIAHAAISGLYKCCVF